MIKDVNNRFTQKIEASHRKQPKNSRISVQLDSVNRQRRVDEIGNWSRALNLAERRDDPDRTDLIRIFKNMRIDGHINGIITTLINKVLAKDFLIVDSEGNEDEKAKLFFESKWFPRYLTWSIEARFYGFSLIQLNDIVDGQFKDMELIDREFVIPDLHIVKQSDTRFSGSDVSWDYTAPNFRDWYIFIGEDKDLGLFNSVAPQAIAKKHMFSALWQFIELFGMPFRVGKTAIDDPAQKKNMIDMLGGMGRAGWGVFGEDDIIEYVQAIDADSAAFIDSIQLANQEISKNFTGVSGLFDDKAFVGSAEAQERVVKELIMSFTRTIMFDIDDGLIPRMQKQGAFPEDRFFRWKADDLLSTMEKGDLISRLLPMITMTPDEIGKELGLKFEAPVADPDSPAGKKVAARVLEIYNKTKKEGK
tara:strand:+ start:2404 stop:3660 length:1257 start_codon:yes stop_codon:yes gene_type:complete